MKKASKGHRFRVAVGSSPPIPLEEKMKIFVYRDDDPTATLTSLFSPIKKSLWHRRQFLRDLITTLFRRLGKALGNRLIDGSNNGDDFQKRGSLAIENNLITPLPNTPYRYDED